MLYSISTDTQAAYLLYKHFHRELMDRFWALILQLDLCTSAVSGVLPRHMDLREGIGLQVWDLCRDKMFYFSDN